MSYVKSSLGAVIWSASQHREALYSFGMDQRAKAFEIEISGEKSSSLGRSGQHLRAALDELQAFDSRADDNSEKRGDTRERLLAAAAEALWFYVVQREVIGLNDADYIRQEYRVPDQVWWHMGPSPFPRERRPEASGLELGRPRRVIRERILRRLRNQSS